jgi:hypothetical protein
VKRGVGRSKQIQEGEKYMGEIEHRKTKTKREREHGRETKKTWVGDNVHKLKLR